MSETNQDLRMDPKEMNFYIKAILECGSRVELFQRDESTPWEMLITPKEGTTVQDFLVIRDNNLHLHMAEGSAIGLLQLLYMAANGKLGTSRKKIFGIF